MAPEKEMVKRNGNSRSEETFPWERRPDESPQAYRAYVLYREMGSKRAFDKLGISHTLARRWASRFRWVTRIAEWETWLTVNQAELNETGRLRHRLASLRLAQSAISKANKIIDVVDKVTVTEAIELSEFGVRTGRVALDLPPDGPSVKPNAESTVLSVSFGQTNIDWLNNNEQNKTKVLVDGGEQVLGETPVTPGRKRLVNMVQDCQEDKGPIDIPAINTVEPQEPKAPEVPPKNAPKPGSATQRCKKHGFRCKNGGHN